MSARQDIKSMSSQQLRSYISELERRIEVNKHRRYYGVVASYRFELVRAKEQLGPTARSCFLAPVGRKEKVDNSLRV